MVGCFEGGDPLPVETRRRLEAHPNVIFTGAVQDTAPYYALADMVVLPSHREGFPTVVLEAQAAGKPVIGAAATGIVDSVVDGETGLLFSVGDVSALAEAIARLVTDKCLATRLGRAGQERVRRDFQQEQIWEALYWEYVGLMQGKQMPLPMTPGTGSGVGSNSNDHERLAETIAQANPGTADLTV